MFTLEEIDRLLAEWKNLLAIASQNLIDLQELPTYQRLVGGYGYPKVQLTGATATRVTPALEATNELFEHFDLLSETVNKANNLRSSISRFLVNEQKTNEIKQLLVGESIKLPAMRTPLAQRGLLTGAETSNAITPKQLLDVMNKAFSVARDAVILVGAAWEKFDANLSTINLELVSLQKLATSLNIIDTSELNTIHNAINSLQYRIETDPLGVSADWEQEVRLPLAKVRAELEATAQKLAQVREKIAIAEQGIKHLREIHQQAESAFAERQEKVVEYSISHNPMSGEQIDALCQWLVRLETKLQEGLVNPVMVGLNNLIVKTQEYIELEKKAVKANLVPLDMRRELRGRLDALSAKALARGLVEDNTLAGLATHAKQLLYTRPTPLNTAAELVSQYEKCLNGKLYGNHK